MPFEALTICTKNQIPKVVKRFGATHLLSLVDPGDRIIPPRIIAPENHLSVTFDDVESPDEFYAPTIEHVREIITWESQLPAETRLVIHCVAGISRSTAVAYGLLCNTMAPEEAMARVFEIRPQASPNTILTRLWDQEL